MKAWLQIFNKITILLFVLFLCNPFLHATPITAPLACFKGVQYKQRFPSLMAAPSSPFLARLDWLSQQFLGVPYQWFVLGEGPAGRVDQCPLYRFDQFDCETYVTTVLALALSHDMNSYQLHLKQLRYHHGKVSFLTRHHFTSVDWNEEAHRLKVLKDITPTIKDRLGKPVFSLSKTLIDKSGWYRHLDLSRVRLLNATHAERLQRLHHIRQQGQAQPRVRSLLTYIPLQALFNKKGEADLFLFKQIPQGAVIEMVRPDWSIKNKIGTNLDVSHVGFAFWHDGQLWFRHASVEKKQVVEQPLIAYLAAARSTPTMGGIHVEKVMSWKTSRI